MQFQFHPQFLVLFCRTNTLDREKKQEGQGLMVHSSTYLYGRERKMCLLTYFQSTNSHSWHSCLLKFSTQNVLRKEIYTVNLHFKNKDTMPMCPVPAKWGPSEAPRHSFPILPSARPHRRWLFSEFLFLFMLTHTHTSLCRW